jgi:hypothetical protein
MVSHPYPATAEEILISWSVNGATREKASRYQWDIGESSVNGLALSMLEGQTIRPAAYLFYYLERIMVMVNRELLIDLRFKEGLSYSEPCSCYPLFSSSIISSHVQLLVILVTVSPASRCNMVV